MTAPDDGMTASSLHVAVLGEQAQEVATAHLRYLGCTCPVDPYDPEDCASVAAEVIRVLEPMVAALVAEQRKAERRKVADLLAEHAGTLAAFAGDKANLIDLLAMMLRLDTEPES